MFLAPLQSGTGQLLLKKNKLFFIPRSAIILKPQIGNTGKDYKCFSLFVRYRWSDRQLRKWLWTWKRIVWWRYFVLGHWMTQYFYLFNSVFGFQKKINPDRPYFFRACNRKHTFFLTHVFYLKKWVIVMRKCESVHACVCLLHTIIFMRVRLFIGSQGPLTWKICILYWNWNSAILIWE